MTTLIFENWPITPVIPVKLGVLSPLSPSLSALTMPFMPSSFNTFYILWPWLWCNGSARARGLTLVILCLVVVNTSSCCASWSLTDAADYPSRCPVFCDLCTCESPRSSVVCHRAHGDAVERGEGMSMQMRRDVENSHGMPRSGFSTESCSSAQ